MTISDTELIRLIREGCEKTLTMLYQSYWPQAKAFAKQNSGREEDAEEIYQDAVMLFYEKVNASDFVVSGAMGGFLMQIFRYKWIKHITRQKPETSLEEWHSSIEMEDNDTLPPNFEHIVANIQNLSERCQDLLAAFYYRHWNMEQIAKHYAYSNTDVAKTAKYKCLQKLKSLLNQDSTQTPEKHGA